MGRRKQLDVEKDAPAIGHNSNLNDEQRTKLSGIVQEIERVDQQVRDLTSERGGIYKAAKESGFDTKALKHVVKMRRMDREHRDAWNNAVDAYSHALGMLADTPLGQAAMKRDLGAGAVAA